MGQPEGLIFRFSLGFKGIVLNIRWKGWEKPEDKSDGKADGKTDGKTNGKSDGKSETGAIPAQPKTRMTLTEFASEELPTLAEIVTFCNSLPMSLYADSTIVKSPEVVFRGLMLSRNRFLSEEYLLNFRHNDADLGVVIGTNNYNMPMVAGALANRDLEEDEENLVALPPYKNVREPIGPVIRSRRSVRHYSGKPISLVDLSTLLFHSAGVSGRLSVNNVEETISFGESDHIDLRSAMSGGGLYPITLYLLAYNVEQLPPAVYRYLPKHHALRPLDSDTPLPDVKELAQFGEIQAENGSFLLCYVYNLLDNSRKYGDAGMGFAFIETGAIATHIHLLCTAMGFGACCVGSWTKHRFERLLDVDGISRHMIHLTVVGK